MLAEHEILTIVSDLPKAERYPEAVCVLLICTRILLNPRPPERLGIWTSAAVTTQYFTLPCHPDAGMHVCFEVGLN